MRERPTVTQLQEKDAKIKELRDNVSKANFMV